MAETFPGDLGPHRHATIVAGCIVLTAGIAVLDAATPSGIAVGSLYVAPIFLSLWSRQRKLLWSMVVSASALTLLGLAISEPLAMPGQVHFNRAIALAMQWMVALAGLGKIESERALDRAARDLLQEKQQLDAVNRELDGFTYSVSHDLRAPLRAIDGFSRILVEDYGDRFDDEGQRVIGVIRSNVGKMGNLIDDLLAFSRLGKHALDPQKIDMGELARRALQDVLEFEHAVSASADRQSRPIETKVEALPACVADPRLVERVWTNLLDNAVKYTRDKDPARIEVTGRIEGDEAVYCVRDNGVGFDMAHADRLFGVFQRLHKASEFEGTGVGLALVRRIVGRHGGTVWAEAEPDQGARFFFSLPRAQESP